MDAAATFMDAASRRPSAVVKVGLATLLFSFNPLLFGAIHLAPLELFWSANVLSAVAVGATLLWQGRVSDLPAVARARSGLLVLLAAAFAGNNLLYIYALKTTTIANSVLAHYAAPIFVFVLGAMFLGEPVARRSITALALALAGLALLLNPLALVWDDHHTAGILLGLGSAVFFAQEIVLKKVLVTTHGALAVVWLYLAVSIVLLGPFIDWSAVASISSHDALWLAVSGIGASAIGISLFMSGLRDVRAQQASVISYIEPLAAIAWGMLFLSERPSAGTLAGGLLILAGTYLIVRDRRS